ncbi:hypothetical protein FQN60_016971 [Etheostoma spectabile]|uniref:UPAR/Ly6 domain-containing protein n=1 Tax=Etheostoma spectabile TaxID=54343 RepID=A0A5J5DE68_9PERO|nr:hypothetical protein FQN60_016971 [Etheostoma spectabile]
MHEIHLEVSRADTLGQDYAFLNELMKCLSNCVWSPQQASSFRQRKKSPVQNELIFCVFAIMMLTLSQASSLDGETLGCVKADECNVETTVELFSNNPNFVMTKHCCVTPICNLAIKLPIATLLYLTQNRSAAVRQLPSRGQKLLFHEVLKVQIFVLQV